MDELTLKSILGKKLNDCTEIELHLFEFCNLNCTFCGQDHSSRVGFDTILDKARESIDFMHQSPLDQHIINVMGGEVFNDLISDELFDTYLEFGKRLLEYGKSSGQKITLNWVTNLIFKRKERVLELLTKLREINSDVNISTSYDFEGRGFAGQTNSLFAKNLEVFGDYVFTIGFVLTAPAIKNYLLKDDPFFDELYQKYTLYFDYYVPEERNSDFLMPSDHDLYEAFSYTANKYPKVYPVKDWLENAENKLTCFSLNKLTLLPDGRRVTCRYLDYKDGGFKNKINYQSNANIVTSFMEENGCLSCPWYQRCSMRCFVQADWMKRERMDGCLYRKFFDHHVEEA